MRIFQNQKLYEVKPLLRLAAPLMINNLAVVGMQFADAVMAGSLGGRELAAVAVGGSVWFLCFQFCLGLLMAISPIAARLYGAGDKSRIGQYTQHAFWLGLILGIIFIVFVYKFISEILLFFGISIEFRGLTVSYIHAMVIGAPGIFAFLAFRFTTEGLGYTRPIMYTSLFALICNVFLNYVFMFGHFGAPALGAVGCGVASAITMWAVFFLFSFYIFINPRYKPFNIFQNLQFFRLSIIREILYLGIPISLMVTAEAGLFSAVSILVGTRGTAITGAHQIALNFSATMFMIPLALSSATSVRVGQLLGSGNTAEARLAGLSGIFCCGIFMMFSALILMVFREGIVGIYTKDISIQGIAVSLLLIAAIFQVVDGIQIGAAGALRGYKDTRIPMFINIFSYWVLAFPLSYMAAITFRLPPNYIWIGFVIGLTIAAILLTTRFIFVSNRYKS